MMLLTLEQIPLAVWSQSVLVISLLLPIVGATGFAFGVLYERWYQSKQLERVRKRFEKLFDHVNALLGQAEHACAALDKQLPDRRLTEAQRKQLSGSTGRLTQRLQDLAGKVGSSGASMKSAVHRVLPVSASKSPKPPRWIKLPVDPRTELPDRAAYVRNIELLQNYAPGEEEQAGVLYVSLDRYAQHSERLGEEVANHFLYQTAGLVLQQLSDDDQLCQVTDDLLIGLLPTSGAKLREIAEATRKTIRNHQYLHLHTQEPVFVTASFGYTRFDDRLVHARDIEQAIWHRGQVALQASLKHGRCQLHEVTSAGSSRLIVG